MRLTRFTVPVLVVGIAVFVALYVAAVGPYWNISPDSATYVGWAKALVDGVPYERGPIQPPLTSILYAIVLAFFPDGYTALNALTLLLILASVAVAFAWVRRQAGGSQALLVVLLTLSSTRLFRESTQLLSEPAYMFLSLAALWFVERTPATVVGESRAIVRPTGRETLIAGVLIVLAVLTRVTGLALVMAVVLSEGWRVMRQKGPGNRLLLGFASAAIAAVVLWELFGSLEPYAVNWFRNFVLTDVWSAGSGTMSIGELVDRSREHLTDATYGGRLLMNEWTPRWGWLNGILPVVGLSACLAGALASLWRRATVAALYTLIYLAVSIAHALGGGGAPGRILLPILPLVIFFAVEAVRGLFTIVSRRVHGPWPTTVAGLCAVAFVSLYVLAGARQVRAGIGEAHRSPFGDYPIKRLSNFDHQRVAMWIRDNARPADTFASWQRDMIEVLAERRGWTLNDGRVTPADTLVTWLNRENIRFLVVDHRSGRRADSLMSAIRQHPGSFAVVTALPGASLYEVIPQR